MHTDWVRLLFYLLLIVCKDVMNTIMYIMNFSCARLPLFRYFTFWTFASLKFGCTRPKLCMHTHDKHMHHPMYNFHFASSMMALCRLGKYVALGHIYWL